MEVDVVVDRLRAHSRRCPRNACSRSIVLAKQSPSFAREVRERMLSHAIDRDQAAAPAAARTSPARKPRRARASNRDRERRSVPPRGVPNGDRLCPQAVDLSARRSRKSRRRAARRGNTAPTPRTPRASHLPCGRSEPRRDRRRTRRAFVPPRSAKTRSGWDSRTSRRCLP